MPSPSAAQQLKRCPVCSGLNELTTPLCVGCGHVFRGNLEPPRPGSRLEQFGNLIRDRRTLRWSLLLAAGVVAFAAWTTLRGGGAPPALPGGGAVPAAPAGSPEAGAPQLKIRFMGGDQWLVGTVENVSMETFDRITVEVTYAEPQTDRNGWEVFGPARPLPPAVVWRPAGFGFDGSGTGPTHTTTVIGPGQGGMAQLPHGPALGVRSVKVTALTHGQDRPAPLRVIVEGGLAEGSNEVPGGKPGGPLIPYHLSGGLGMDEDSSSPPVQTPGVKMVPVDPRDPRVQERNLPFVDRNGRPVPW
jgi:hypothetical protein